MAERGLCVVGREGPGDGLAHAFRSVSRVATWRPGALSRHSGEGHYAQRRTTTWAFTIPNAYRKLVRLYHGVKTQLD